MTQPTRKAKATLPAKSIIRLGRFAWTTMWHLMMSRLAPRDASGAYIRPASEFRNAIDTDSNRPYLPATGRYRLYVGLGCPWAHRTLVVRALKGLEDAISVTIVSPSPEAGGWIFDTPENGLQTLAELYQQAKPGYTGRSTVPVLWDTQTQTIVNNESAEIIVMLNDRLNEFSQYPELNLYPAELREAIDSWNEKIYDAVNNGVYRCGFAQTQAAYDTAVNELFTVLNEIDVALEHQRYLCGNRLTLADVRLFTTLIRFDAVYYGLFKCDRRRIQDYPNLAGYLRDLYQLPGVASTCDLEVIKRDYYGNLFPLNPGGIIPTGSSLDTLLAPHDRAKLKDLF
ncbi:glutathione S-transferase family protein [Leptolyngbya sp. FACHB-711]|uniref:glutathione S-transferase family protein n=1 Tax=unclassified Leptolyngbya TaxID=2650499 RepID=UPI0016835B02|nr:glutathione S-transferase family protein [Leptolyngbya sp. FACHB-711]MBD2023979.1 glutathione S-transferase family protein [Leptolyngbya sp. FACHB-711]